MIKRVAGAFLLLAAGACGGGTSGGFQPRSPEQMVLKIEDVGGFMPPQWSLTMLPSLVLYADGTLIVPGPQIEIYPPPALPNLRTRKVSKAKVQEVVEVARGAGLSDGDKKYENNMVMDASTAVFTLDDGERKSVVQVYALGLSDESGPRKKISDFRTEVFVILGEGEDEPYQAERFQVVTAKASAEQMPEGGLEAPPKRWPLDEPAATFGDPYEGRGLEGARCGVTSGDQTDKLVAALASANALTRWESDGGPYQMYARPLVPGEEGCSA